jgi:hypothetical protein
MNTQSRLSCWVVIGLATVLVCIVAIVIVGNVNKLGAHVASGTADITRVASGIQK